jgi:hypothetical protein
MWTGVVLALVNIRDSRLANIGFLLIPLIFAGFLLAAASGPEAEERYRVPAMPMLALVAAFGWTTQFQKRLSEKEPLDKRSQRFA